MPDLNADRLERLEAFSRKVESAVGDLIDKAAGAISGSDAAGFAQAASMLTPTLIQVAHALAHGDEDEDETPKEFMH